MARRRGQRKGHLRKKGPSWLGSWYEDVRTSQGVQRMKVSRVIARAVGPGAKTKRQAERIFWDDVLSRLDEATRTPQSIISLREFVSQRFEPDVIARCRSDHYKQTLRHVLPALGSLRLRDVRPQDVQSLLTEMRGAGFSWQWQKHIKTTVGSVFRHAKRMGYYSGDLPTEFITLGEPVRRERGALSAEQVWAIAQMLEQPYRAMVLVLACVGLRISEALGLRWKRLNLTPETVQVDGELLGGYMLSIREGWVRQSWTRLKTTGSKGMLPLPDAVVMELAALKARAAWAGPEDPVFTVHAGQPLEPSTAAHKKLKPVLRALGLSERVSWHWFRHTLASLADQAGMSVPQRQRLLRHSDAAMTQHYTHTEVEELRAGLNAVANRIVVPSRRGVM